MSVDIVMMIMAAAGKMNTEGEKETMTGEGIGLPAIVMSPLKKN
jgi:hypothetical protein